MKGTNNTRPLARKRVHGVVAHYESGDAKWFAFISFVPMIVGCLGMFSSSISYLGWSLDIGLILGLERLVLAESVLLIPVYFLLSMLFFAGGVEWYVLCRHCPCYEYSGCRHGHDNRFYCLANWGSPKVFEYSPKEISRGGQAVFVAWVLFYLLFPIVYLWDRVDWAVVQVLVAMVFAYTLQHWACSSCPNFGCVLNSVPDSCREAFLEALEAGEVYGTPKD